MAQDEQRQRDWSQLFMASIAALVLLVDLSLILIGGAVASGVIEVG